MDTVFDLWFEREYPDREDTELHIGIYATEADAVEAISRLRDQPGFRDYPDGFQIHPTTLGRTGWQEGFVTVYYPAMEREAADLPPPSQALRVDSENPPDYPSTQRAAGAPPVRGKGDAPIQSDLILTNPSSGLS